MFCPRSFDRLAQVPGDLLDAVVRTRAHYAILDLTGVDRVDGAVAGHVARIIQGIALLGAECLVCGIRPQVAQAMVALEATTGKARTFRTIQAALQAVIQRGQSR